MRDPAWQEIVADGHKLLVETASRRI